MTFDNTSVLKSKLRWNSIAKPLGGLGLLEDMVSKIAGIQRTDQSGKREEIDRDYHRTRRRF